MNYLLLITVLFVLYCTTLTRRTLELLSIQLEKHFPIAAPVLSSDFHMDDILTGSDT